VLAAIGAVGEHITRLVGQHGRTFAPVVNIGWRHRHRLDQRGVGIGADGLLLESFLD